MSLQNFVAVLAAASVTIEVNGLIQPEVVNESYDYVIVGGGTSGLTVANRLSADARRKITLARNLLYGYQK